jgi:hypothetical protein
MSGQMNPLEKNSYSERSKMFRWISSWTPGWRIFLSYARERDTFIRSTKTSLLVGTILGLINHGSAFLAGHFTLDHIGPMLLTYLVPFSVATYAQVQGKRQRDTQNQTSSFLGPRDIPKNVRVADQLFSERVRADELVPVEGRL